MAIKIFTDAGSNLYKSILKIKHLDITVVNLSITIDGKDYRPYETDEDVAILSKDFYEKLRNGADVRTSLVNPDMWYNAFKKEIDRGNQIICFTMASGISGTYQSACIAASMIEEETNKKCVKVIDSKTAGFGEGLQAIKAYELANNGMNFTDLVGFCEDFVLKVRSEFIVGDIKFLAKTGRVNALVAKIASVLNIKPILKGSDEAKIVMAKKVFGKNRVIKTLVEDCLSHIRNADDQILYITHCDALEEAKQIEALLKSNGIKNIECYDFDLTTGGHVGPGTVAIFYVGENRN